MRLFAIGDIHGCATALDVILAAIGLRSGDKVIGLGDYINKGPETKQVLDKLIQLFDQGFLIPLWGNHELKLLEAGRLKQTQTATDTLVDVHTLDSYSSADNVGSLGCIPDAHWRFVQESCLPSFMSDRHIFTHATPDADKALSDQSNDALFWNKFVAPQPHVSGKILVCGHTPQRSGTPINIGHAICLDTAACEGQWLTCLEVNSGKVWQANQQRHLRCSRIEEYFGAKKSLLAERSAPNCECIPVLSP
jgi:serine/threonine protein phosphatase 1